MDNTESNLLKLLDYKGKEHKGNYLATKAKRPGHFEGIENQISVRHFYGNIVCQKKWSKCERKCEPGILRVIK